MNISSSRFLCAPLLLILLFPLCPLAGESGRAEAATVERPRLLIGKQDPYTGLELLRLRYAAGLHPPDDISGLALSWLLTGNQDFAKRALDQMRQSHPATRGRSGNYLEYVRWALAFDWLYDASGFDPALKDRIAGELLSGAERMLQDGTLRDPAQASYQNYAVRYLALASFALAAVQGHSSVESRAMPLRVRTDVALDNILETSQLVTPDGGYHESMDYHRLTLGALTLMAELRRTTTGVDPAQRFTLFRNLGNTYLYKVLPDGTTAREDDNEFPFLHNLDSVVLGYAVSHFKNPYAAWILRESGWLSGGWPLPVLQFLWDDPLVKPRNPALTGEAELPRQFFFRGINHWVARNGWEPGSTWIEFSCGPYFAKHDHLDQNHFTIYHKGYLAIDSGADYTDTESPHYLNYYRRTVAHNTLLVYKPGEEFFWAGKRWKAANDGGQRMDSSRFWNSIRGLEDWRRTRDLWEGGRMEAVDGLPGHYAYARGNASRSYDSSKLERFVRQFCYLPGENRVIVYDQVKSTDPHYKKVWLLHGVQEPVVEAASGKPGKQTGHGGTAFSDPASFSFSEQQGILYVHSLLPREREVVKRGGPGWEFWTPGDAQGGEYGTGQNWPLIPAEGGALPEDPYLRSMWKTFWGESFNRILRSNVKAVVPGAWRMEVSPAKPAQEDEFLHVLEIGDLASFHPAEVRLAEGKNLKGAFIAGGTAVLFAAGVPDLNEREIRTPDVAARALLILGVKPDTHYELQMTGPGMPPVIHRVESNASGNVFLREAVPKNVRLRVKPVL
jgi:hypothetical protein